MSETSTQNRTERATPKRLREARQRGELPRSRELVTAAVVGAAALGALGFSSGLVESAHATMRSALVVDAALLADPGLMPQRFAQLLGQGLLAVAPLLVAAFIAALVAPVMLGGWNFAPQSLQPDFGRLSPLQGFQRMFSKNSLVELGKGLAKVLVLGGITALVLWRDLDALIGLAGLPPESGIAWGVQLAVRCMAWLTGGLFLIAAIDVPYQLFSYQQRLRMTRQELRDEFKESEGRPEVKGRQRRLQSEIANRRMMEQVPKADVIVTNPTHYAVALQYSAGTMRAPKVVALGADLVAQAIRELAQAHKVPIVSAPPLARALYRDGDLEQEIPVALYAAVAQVLSYVYQLRNWKRGMPWPSVPDVGDVPNGAPDPE